MTSDCFHFRLWCNRRCGVISFAVCFVSVAAAAAVAAAAVRHQIVVQKQQLRLPAAALRWTNETLINDVRSGSYRLNVSAVFLTSLMRF